MGIKRVALFGPYWGRSDGWSRVVEKLTYTLAQYVNEVLLFLAEDSPRRKVVKDNIYVRYLLPKITESYNLSYLLLQPWKKRLNLIKEFLTSEADLVQVYDVWPYSLDASIVTSLTKIPLFIGAHGTAALKPLIRGLTRSLLKNSCCRANGVLCISRYTLNILRKTLRLRNLILQPLDGVDYEHFSKPRDIKALRERWNGRILLSVCAIQERKGLDISMMAFKYVKKKFKDVKYIVIGRGDCSKYVELMREQNITDVYFLSKVSDEELAKYYQLCDIYILTPKRVGWNVEGFGLTYLEANAAGKPVIGSISGGVPDVIRHGETGLLVPERDVKATARALTTLLEEENYARELGTRGKYWAKHFDWRNISQQVIEVWEKCL